MKKKLFKTLTLIMATILIISSFSVATFAENQKQCLRTQEEARVYIEKYANEIDEEGRQYRADNSRRIESFTAEKRYLLFSLSPSGYAIYDEISGVVEEMMIGGEDPYKDAKEGILYYGGPMNYILQKNDSYFLISGNIKLSVDDIEALTNLEKYTATNRNKTAKGIPQTTDYYYMSSSSYFTSLLGDRFGNNVSGTCTHIACAIMLGYYNYYVNTQFVPTGYEDGCGTTENFHAYLQTFLGSAPSGLANAANGLSSYFSAIFFTTPTVYYDIGNHNTVYNRVVNRVYNNRPTIIAMFSSYNQNCPINHSVVAYGYRETLSGSNMTSAAYFVHNGWHGTHTGTYAWDWFADDLYIA